MTKSRSSPHNILNPPNKLETACLMLIHYKHLRAIKPRQFAFSQTRYLHSLTRPVFSCSNHASPAHQSWKRGKKTKSSMKLDDLHQGVIPLEPLALEHDTPAYPTVVLQARSNMRKFENCILLTRVGGFYELYFEHADEFGPLMNLKVAQKRTNAGPVSMVCCSKIGSWALTNVLGRISVLPAGSIFEDPCSGFQSLCCNSGRVSKQLFR